MIDFLRKLFNRPKKVQEAEPQGFRIWGVLRGPTFSHEIPDSGFPEGSVMMVLKVEEDGEVFDAEFWFDNLSDAEEITKHFKDSINPINVNFKDLQTYDNHQ